MSDFSVVVGVTWAALAGFGLDFFSFSWSCRLEDIMGRARDMGAIHPSEVKRMLHDILWNGLRKDLKDTSMTA
jgi:hypothetical protein